MKKLTFVLTALFGTLLPTIAAQAVCPVCTVAVAAGVGLSRWLGIDDSVSGLWVGALTMSASLWTINWLNKKNIRFKGRKILVLAGYYLLVIAPLYKIGVMGHPYNKLWGMDKLLLGIILGSVAFLGGSLLHDYLKKKHGNKSYFPLQSTAVPVVLLLILSGSFYFITK